MEDTVKDAKRRDADRRAAERLQIMEHYYWYGDFDAEDLEVLHDRILKLRERIAGR